MAPSRSTVDLAHSHIASLEDTLRQLGQRHDGVLQALADRQAALEREKHAVDALHLQDEAMRATRVALQADIDARRASSERDKRGLAALRVRRILAAFPEEVLRAIFLEATNLEDELWPPTTGDYGLVYHYGAAAAATPFSIACVDRRWRALALRTAEIWIHVTVSGLGMDGSSSLERVKTMLRRSKNHDVYLMICWESCDWAASPDYKRILDALEKHTRRWRKLTFTAAKNMPDSAWDFLRRGPMDHLEDLHVWTSSMTIIDWLAPSDWLPLHPRLRRLRNNAISSVPRLPLTQLVHLSMIPDGRTPIDIWTSVRMAPSLVELYVDLPLNVNWSGGPPSPLPLPHLELLGLTGTWNAPAAWLHSLQLPCLDRLVLDIESLGSLSQIFDTIAQTLTSLEIREVSDDFPFLAAEMGDVRKLHQLRRLSFFKSKFVGPDIPVVLASREAAALPRLESISIVEPKLDDKQAGFLANLMESLCTPALSGQDDAVTFILKASAPNVPDWLLQRHRYFTNCDEPEVDACSDVSESDSESSDDEDEDEPTASTSGST